jgi:hypothetical protein
MSLCQVAQETPVLRLDDSDWWSGLRNYNSLNLSDPKNGLQHRQLADTNYQILGITISQNDFAAFAAKLGKAAQVSRGDAANSRSQVCYSSQNDSQLIYLILENDGEGFGSSFFLFADGEPWNGQKYCVKSPLISADLRTSSGLHLSLTRSEVQAILGMPSTVAQDKLQYLYQVRKRTSHEDLTQLRRQHPELPDQDFHESFDFSYVNAYVEARFVHSKLNYLAVTKSEAYP